MRRATCFILFTFVLMPLAAHAGSVPTFHATHDSMLVVFGVDSQRVSIKGLKSPDTTHLPRPEHDLILQSTTDSLYIAQTDSAVTVYIIRTSDTLIETFYFRPYNQFPVERYLPLLKQYPSFGQSPLPQFSGYEVRSPQDSSLVRIRERYKLDSIAGNGSEVSRILNLLHWVHTSITYNGNKEAPTGSLIDQVDSCINNGRTMHCGALAGTFVSVCNAMGFPARRIVCLPYDSNDLECHSTTIVYSDSLGKWLYMDPTFEAYFMDADSNLLCTRKVRDRLANGEPILINAAANTNGSPKDPEEYIGYMGKNLFHFLTWGADGRGIMLNPVGYRAEDNGKEAMFTRNKEKVLCTDNADIFWAKPVANPGN